VSAILSVNYRNAASGQRLRTPRMLRILAIIALVFAAAHGVVALLSMSAFWPFDANPAIPPLPRVRWRHFIVSNVELISSALLIGGGLQLLRRGLNWVILIGCWGMLIQWLARIALAAVIVHHPQYWGIFILTIIDDGQMSLFPILVILLLRAHGTGYTMEPQQVISIDQSPQSAGPRPRIIRILAVMSMTFAFVSILSDALRIWWSFKYNSLRPMGHSAESWAAIQARFNLIAVLNGLVSAFIAAVAFWLLKRGRGQRLLMAGLGMWLMIWVIDLGIQSITFGVGQLIARLPHTLIHAALPVAVLLALREYVIGLPEIERETQ